jgi:hypothetical protein
VKLLTTEVAAAYVELPACAAVIEHVPIPSKVTVKPEIEQLPTAEKVTVRLDVAFAETVKVPG